MMGEAVKFPRLPVVTDAEGNRFQPVRVRARRFNGTLGHVLPFGEQVLRAWSELDGVDRRFLLRQGAVNVPLAIYQQLAPIARARLTPAEAAEVDE